MPKTAYIRKKDYDMTSVNCPSAGPRPNVTGMRNKYWGKDALLVRQGAYVYKPNRRQCRSIRAALGYNPWS